MTYPSTIDTFREIEDYPGVVIDPERKDTVYAADTIELQEAIVAVEETVGVDPAGEYADVAARLAAMEAYAEALAADVTTLDSALAALKLPVGSLYYNADSSTNPATLLGYGTWVAFGQGRVIVGKASSGTFATNGATGGSETNTLTIGQLPAHTHGSGGGQGNTGVRSTAVAGGSHTNAGTVNNSTNNSTASTGNGDSINNLQPYIVVYCWRRTA